MHSSIADRRKSFTVFLAIFMMLMVPLFVKDPWGTMVRLAGTAVVVGMVVVVVRWFRGFIDSRITTRWLEHESRTVRVATRVTRGYGIYAVGFWTVIATLLVFQVLGWLL